MLRTQERLYAQPVASHLQQGVLGHVCMEVDCRWFSSILCGLPLSGTPFFYQLQVNGLLLPDEHMGLLEQAADSCWCVMGDGYQAALHCSCSHAAAHNGSGITRRRFAVLHSQPIPSASQAAPGPACPLPAHSQPACSARAHAGL
jgi:hypothetical protein